jgi:hypothetical protein
MVYEQTHKQNQTQGQGTSGELNKQASIGQRKLIDLSVEQPQNDWYTSPLA